MSDLANDQKVQFKMHFSGKILIPKVGRAEVKLVLLYNSEKQYKIIVQLLDSIL